MIKRNIKPANDNMFEVSPDLPEGKGGRYGEPVKTITLSAVDAEDALRRAVVSGFIPSNTTMQYYRATKIQGRR